ncbi:hypothetical protein [Hymenobacter koreensis]|uniref:DUF4384 domain-containing protein n=1 Tax=Hymenobacter koreensis TaxID=1084523 RepID=A0ABP8ITC5_9BACT
MATDGVKIIDSDHAHDVYHTFMDLYDQGLPVDEIKASVRQQQMGDDDFYDELFITAYALALWETGNLTAQETEEVKLAIDRQAFVKYLRDEEQAPNDAAERQRVLNRFWAKINQPNPRIRKRKNYKPQTKFIFNEGDVLAFQMPEDGTYRATILLLISQNRGRCIYYFAFPTYSSTRKPTLDDIVAGEIMGRVYAPPNFPEYRLGFDVTGIGHKHLRAIADQFECIGHLKINPIAQCLGSQAGATNFENFTSFWSSDVDARNDFFDFLPKKQAIAKTALTHPGNVFPIHKLL